MAISPARLRAPGPQSEVGQQSVDERYIHYQFILFTLPGEFLRRNERNKETKELLQTILLSFLSLVVLITWGCRNPGYQITVGGLVLPASASAFDDESNSLANTIKDFGF